MTSIVNKPFPPNEAVYLDYAISRFDSSLDIRDGVAAFSLFSSLLALYVMIRMKIYKYSLMSIIFFMTFLQAIYDATIFTAYCGDPAVSLENSAGVQSQEWIECRSTQMSFVRSAGIGVGICTNIISAAVSYVIYYQKRLPLNFLSVAALALVPSIVIGVMFGYYFYEQTLQNGLKGYLGGQSNFNIINFIYIAVTTILLIINVICVAYISLHFYRSGMLKCWERRKTHHMEEGMPGNSLSARPSDDIQHNTFDPNHLQRKSSMQRLDVGPVGKHSVKYPMFSLAKRLIFYPVVQSFVTFGCSFYAYGQGGESTEAYIWNVTSNPHKESQTFQLYCFSALMPIAGFGYFLTFMTFQKGAWGVLIDTFTKEIPGFFGLPACECSCLLLWCRRAEAREKARQANLAASTSDIGNDEQRHAPNPSVHDLYHSNKTNSSPPSGSQNVPPDSDGFNSPQAAHNHRHWVNSDESNPHAFRDHNRHDDTRTSYTFDERDDGHESRFRKSNTDSVVSSNDSVSSSSRRDNKLHDINLRDDSITYYQDRMSMFREIASSKAQSVANHLSTVLDLCQEDIDEMQEDDLIELIEITATRSSASRVNNGTDKNSQTEKTAGTGNPMH